MDCSSLSTLLLSIVATTILRGAVAAGLQGMAVTKLKTHTGKRFSGGFGHVSTEIAMGMSALK